MDQVKEYDIKPIATSIINPNLKRRELKGKAVDMVVGLDSSNIEEFNPQSSKENRLLNKFYNRYQRKFEKDRFINTPVTEVLKWDPKKQERWFAAKKNQSAAPILGGIVAVGSLPWTLTGATTAFKGASFLYKQLPQWVRTTVDVGLTVDGIRNISGNNGLQKTIREAKSGNYGKAVLSGIGDIADIVGGTSLTKRVGNGLITRIRNRNIYTYNNISPASYKFSDHKREILPWIKDFIFNKTNLNPKYTLTDKLSNFVSAKNATQESKASIAKIGRDEAWRKYLGIESKYPVFISNPDGSVSYNMSYLRSLLRPQNVNLPTDFQIKSFEDGIKRDFITGAFGGVDQNTGIELLNNSVLNSISKTSLLPNRRPYFRYRYLTPQELRNYSIAISSKTGDAYTATDGIERYGVYHMKNIWDLHPFKNKNNSISRILSMILPKKISNYEIGKLLGGKPFTLNTYIDYSDKFYRGSFRGVPIKNRYYKDFKSSLQ